MTCAPLAEQQNSRLRRLESHVLYMKQTTFLWYIRFYLHRLNKLEGLAASDRLFYKRNRAS